MKAKIQKVFDSLSTVYENQVDDSSFYNTQYERPGMLAELEQELHGKKILDAGCAAGWYANELLLRGADVTAVDVSPQMIAATKRRIGDRGKALCLDLEEPLPFPDSSFDLIISSLTLHYLQDWTKVFAEFNRVLKSGGEYLFSVHHPFMDINISENKCYFETEALTDIWNKQGKEFEVPMYRRPLQDIINETTKAFTLTSIKELQPTTKLKELKAESYQYLMNNPHFLLIKAKKQ